VAPLRPEIDRLLREAGVPGGRQARAREAILGERLGERRIGRGWLLRLPPSASFWRLAREAGLPRHLAVLSGMHGLQYVLWLLSWWLIGQGTFRGQFEFAWFAAWGLLLLTLVPFQRLVGWRQGLFALTAGGLLKQRLLYGALRLDQEEMRHQGIGQVLGRVIESGAVEQLALTGGFMGVVALVEIAIATFVLAAGAGGGLHLALLAGWMLLSGLLTWRYYGLRRRWTEARLGLTHDLVEGMVGHRTRLAQEPPERWHTGEDQALAHYLSLAVTLERTERLLMALVPRGWLPVGVLGLFPAFVGGGASAAGLAVGLGGVILVHRALRRGAMSMITLTEAVVALQHIRPLFQAASRPVKVGLPGLAVRRDPRPPAPGPLPPTAVASPADGRGGAEGGESHPLLEAYDLVFRYRERGEPVLRRCSLCIRDGDRLLLEGPSGGGKSTLATLLAGLRRPESGLILLHGLDWQTLGATGWRRRVVAAPQFHENHVITETFAFNLLMGRRWPPRQADLEEAETICRELGLGELLDRMPGGLMQMVGEMGWQLSHGERSRLFIARALLQNADLIILDESFAALDPETLRLALQCVLRRAPTLLVIAHP
jgi:ATP-binding cassette subfamily B protein